MGFAVAQPILHDLRMSVRGKRHSRKRDQNHEHDRHLVAPGRFGPMPVLIGYVEGEWGCTSHRNLPIALDVGRSRADADPGVPRNIA